MLVCEKNRVSNRKLNPYKQQVKAFILLSMLLLSTVSYALEASSSIKITPLLKSDTSWNGVPITYPEGKAEITGMIVEIAVGAETGWHLHPVASFGMMIEGELEVRLKDGKTKLLKAGDGLVEVVNTLHNGKNVGAVPVKLVVFYTGVVGQPLSIKHVE